MIFISYSWQDIKVVNSIIKQLRLNGNSIWIDFEMINLNNSIKDQIDQGIIECKQFLQVRSMNSKDSNWIDYEYNIAIKSKRPENIIILEV